MLRWRILLGLMPLLGGCGPSALDAAQSILLMAPIITMVGFLLELLYVTLWRRLQPELEFSVGPSIVLVGASLLLLLGSVLVRGPAQMLDWAIAALVLVGSSYLSLLCITLWVLVRPSTRHWLSRAPLIPWILLGPPVLFHAFASSPASEFGAFSAYAWILPGYGGLVTAPLLIALFAEVLVRRYAHGRPDPAPPAPVFPTARVVKSPEDRSG